MRLALTAALLALIVSGGAYLLTLGPEGHDGAPAPGAAAPAPAPGSPAEIALLLGDAETLGYGAAPGRGGIRRDGRGAVFLLPGGLEIRLAPPEGTALSGRFTLRGPRAGGFLLDAAEAGEIYLAFAHAGRQLEPAEAEAARGLYDRLAGKVREGGALPFLDRRLAVGRVTADRRGVYYCLTGADGTPFQGGTRFVGPLSVTAMRAGACPEAPALVTRRLDLAEATLADNRLDGSRP